MATIQKPFLKNSILATLVHCGKLFSVALTLSVATGKVDTISDKEL